MVLSELARDFHPAEVSQSEEGFQVFCECCGPRLQLSSRQKEFPDQLTVRKYRSVGKPTKLSLDERRRYASEAEAAPQFCRRYALSAPNV